MKGIPAFALILWSTAVVAAPHFKRSDDNQAGIEFNCKLPVHSANLPTFLLGSQAIFPIDKLQTILKSAAPNAKLTEKDVDGSRFYYDADQLVGYFDRNTGKTSVFPKLGSLKPGTIKPGDLSQFLKNSAIIPNDETKYSIVIGSRFSGSQKTFSGKASAPATYLLESVIQREIPYDNELHPVCGPGSKASFSFGADGSIMALSHRMRSAKSQSSTITPLSQEEIQRAIVTQLAAANIKTNVTVKAVSLCFFDSGNKFIQPVFRYNATVSHPFGLSDNVIVGYVPAGGKELETLPTLTPPTNQAMPAFARNSTTTDGTVSRSLSHKRQSNSITVGRYVMSNDQYSPQFVTDANNLWNGLSSVSNRFINSQYYWDEPVVYESAAQSYVNHVNIAYTEGHGNVHYFTTNELEPSWGGVQIASDLPAQGYGPGAGGSLAYWIINTCDTVSTPMDYAPADFDLAFEPWWTVFNGMHAVMGYRTLSAVYDGNEMGDVGTLFGNGASAIFAWMNAALGAGKTSAVTVCGHDDDTVFQIENISRPECLRIWWYS